MASTILVVIFLCILSMAHTLPVVQDLQPNDMELLSQDVYNPENFVRHVDSPLIRDKRQVIKGNGCPRGKIFFQNICMDFKRYETILNGDYDT